MKLTTTMIEGRSLEEAQIELEGILLRQGYDKTVAALQYAFEEANKDGDVFSLPRGKQLFMGTYNSVLEFVKDYTDQESKKSRKSNYYKYLFEPTTQMYKQEMQRKHKFTSYTIQYDDPVKLISYFIARELSKLMVVEDRMLTEFSRKIANSFMTSYNFFGEASDEELTGMIQFIRTYISSKYCEYFKTINKNEGIIITLVEEFESYKVTEEELLEAIDDSTSAFKPMLVQPIEHKNLLDSDGGYRVIKSPVLKSPEFAEVRQMKFTSTDNYGKEFFTVLNNLQNTKWSVNVEFYEWLKECTHPTIQQMFNNDIKKLQGQYNKYKKNTCKEIRVLKKTASKARWEYSQTTNEAKRDALERIALNANDDVDVLELKVQQAASELGKKRGWMDTIDDVEFYKNFDYFYHPVFCDNRGRVYTYNVSLSFQGSSLAKSLINSYDKQRLTEEGRYELQVLLGGMLDGYDKKVAKVRYNRVQELTAAFDACIMHEDYSVLDLVDEDELLMALNIMLVLKNHKDNPEYKTGILAYIDATSSAIQIQAVIQKCTKAASLTNLLKNDTEDLPDAYMAVSHACRHLCEEIAAQSDAELYATLAAFYLENDNEKLPYLGMKM